MELWVGALNLGFLYAFMTMGVFITSRIFDFPDITVDGSFTTGAAIAAVLIAAGWNPALAVAAAFVLGALAGTVTAIIHTRLHINGLLAGILVMTGLYSINLHIMGKSNIPLLNQTTFLTYLERINPHLPAEIWICLVLFVVMIGFWLVVSLFFCTDMGISMRATGNNPTMSSASGVNVNRMKIFGVALANGFTGVSGAMVAQYQGYTDLGMGIGTIVVGLAAVIIGESILRFRSMYVKIAAVILGSVLFRLLIATALTVGMDPMDLKLMTAVFVLLTLVLSKFFVGGSVKKGQPSVQGAKKLSKMRQLIAIGAGTILLLIAGYGLIHFLNPTSDTPKQRIIGVVQVADNGLLNITRDSLAKELESLGYQSGKNCTIYLENANGELPTVNTILDRFLQLDVDIVVSISTPCTQAAVNKIKDRPLVFATVANPFIIEAGKTDTDHLPNVTGVYGLVPMDQTLQMVRKILPGPLKVGCIWDPAHANSVYNVESLQKAIQAFPDILFEGATITNSSEVQQAALSLIPKGINAFVLAPDNIVYSAFESVVKAARTRNIPIFMSDIERLPDGALGVLGYDYTSSGIQTAHLVDRILKGENPKDIPFEQYKIITRGFNLDVAKEIGLSIPPELIEQSDVLVEGKTITKGSITGSRKSSATPATSSVPPKKVALMIFSENTLLSQTADGLLDELKQSEAVSQYHLTIDIKNAQNEFSMAQSIVQEAVSKNYDYLLTLSTPMLQVTAQVNKKIPHVFGAVTDPYRMGVAKTPEDHIPNITGVATFQPVEKTIEAMREVFPKAKTIGYIWNPAEACSEACTEKARATCKQLGFELVETNVSSTSEVMDALKSLLTRNIDLFFTSGDNTVNLALESIAEILRPRKIPYFSNAFSDVERGVLISLGADYDEVGREVARMFVRVLKGENPKAIPINNYTPRKMYVNLALAKEYGLTLPEEFIKRAAKVKE